MKVICDECNKEFFIETEDLIETKLTIDNKKVSTTWFKCSHCNKKYITSCIDDYIEKEQRRYEKLVDNCKKNKTSNQDRRIKCLNNMKTHSDRLKLKVIGLL